MAVEFHPEQKKRVRTKLVYSDKTARIVLKQVAKQALETRKIGQQLGLSESDIQEVLRRNRYRSWIIDKGNKREG